ncbi:MAG: pilus assembly protein [Deltaproteobacteria bacterium]|nr:pilus assembly protein [Deltaproteobacteria bacterium]
MGSIIKIVTSVIRWRSYGERRRRSRGQAAVEMTFAFMLFFSIFMAIVEFSHLLYAKVTLQHALRTAGRYMVTGQTTKDTFGVNIPRDQKVHDIFCAHVIAAGVVCPALGPSFVFKCPELPLPSNCTTPGGAADQTVLVTVTVKKPALFPFFNRFFPAGGIPFVLNTTWKNEPFVNT